MESSSYAHRTAREVAAERIAQHGNVTIGDFLARLPYSVEDTYKVVDQMVAAGELVEIVRLGPKPADRAFIHPRSLMASSTLIAVSGHITR